MLYLSFCISVVEENKFLFFEFVIICIYFFRNTIKNLEKEEIDLHKNNISKDDETMLVAAGPSHTTFSQYGNSEDKLTSSSNTPSSISSAKYNLIRSVAAHINRGTEIIKETVQNHIISRLSTSSSVTTCSTTAKTTSISSLNNPIKNEKCANDSLVLTSPRKDTDSANSFEGECCHFRTIEELPSHTIKRYNMLIIMFSIFLS